MKVATAALFLILLLAAGCGSPGTRERIGSTSTGPPDSTTSHELPMEFRSQLILYDALPESAVRLAQSQAQHDEAVDGCLQEFDDAWWGIHYYWVSVWNRTGLALYQQWTVEDQVLLNRTVVLPADPPYLVIPGMTCFGSLTVSFEAATYLQPPEGRGEDQPGAIVRASDETWVDVRIPAGSTEGVGTLRVGAGDTYEIEAGMLPGDVEFVSGNEHGDLYVYEPNTSLAGDAWMVHTSFKPLEDDWEHSHVPTAMPGDYRFKVVLVAPSVGETVWRVRLWTYEFRPAIEEHGFARPFELYDTAWNTGDQG